MRIREQTYKVCKISEIVKDPSKNDENTNQTKLHESYYFGYAIHTKDRGLTGTDSGITHSYKNEIKDIDNVDDLVKKVIKTFGLVLMWFIYLIYNIHP